MGCGNTLILYCLRDRSSRSSRHSELIRSENMAVLTCWFMDISPCYIILVLRWCGAFFWEEGDYEMIHLTLYVQCIKWKRKWTGNWNKCSSKYSLPTTYKYYQLKWSVCGCYTMQKIIIMVILKGASALGAEKKTVSIAWDWRLRLLIIDSAFSSRSQTIAQPQLHRAEAVTKMGLVIPSQLKL